MSFYTVFDHEAVVTSTTTSVLQSSDPILIASSKQSHAAQSTVGSVAVQGLVTTSATTLTTATVIPAMGLTQITCTSTSIVTPVWTLADPTSVGLCKTLLNLTTSTSTLVKVTPAAAGIISTDVSSGTAISVLFSAYGAYAELQAASTSVWLMVGRSAAGCGTS